MTNFSERSDEVKRKLRKLKKLEMKIRFGNESYKEYTLVKELKNGLVWDEFFNTNVQGGQKVRYSFDNIVTMNKDDFKNIINEFFINVYYRYYKENGIVNLNIYNPEILNWMGLPSDSGFEDIKKKFRKLAMKYHPDRGGDGERFIELMENYKKLLE